MILILAIPLSSVVRVDVSSCVTVLSIQEQEILFLKREFESNLFLALAFSISVSCRISAFGAGLENL